MEQDYWVIIFSPVVTQHILLQGYKLELQQLKQEEKPGKTAAPSSQAGQKPHLLSLYSFSPVFPSINSSLP